MTILDNKIPGIYKFKLLHIVIPSGYIHLLFLFFKNDNMISFIFIYLFL